MVMKYEDIEWEYVYSTLPGYCIDLAEVSFHEMRVGEEQVSQEKLFMIIANMSKVG